jgi:predicted HTH transcriptional regulator
MNTSVTSTVSIKEHTESGKRKSNKERVFEALRAWPFRTSRELAKLSGIPHETVHKRLPDLLKDDRVKQAQIVTCVVTGKRAVCWHTNINKK